MCDVNSDEQKKVRFGVSMAAGLCDGADRVAKASFGGNRSAYLEDLVDRDLQARGVVRKPSRISEMAEAAAQVLGEDRVAELLKAAGCAALATAATGGTTS